MRCFSLDIFVQDKRKIAKVNVWRTSAALLLALSVSAITGALMGCGVSSTSTTTTTTTTTSQPPNYPSVPPEQITWPFADPASTDVPAPPPDNQTTAAWKDGANDFPLTVSGPASGAALDFADQRRGVRRSEKQNTFYARLRRSGLRIFHLRCFDRYANLSDPGRTHPDGNGEISKATFRQRLCRSQVSAQAPTTNGQTVISGIQAAPGWQSCSADFPAGSGRAGQLCAAGGGTPQSTLTQNVSSPSMDSNSAESDGIDRCGHHLRWILQHAVLQSGSRRE